MDWIMALKVPDGSAGALVSVGHLQALVGLLAVFLFGLRTRWAWPVLLVQQAMVFLLLVIPNFEGGRPSSSTPRSPWRCWCPATAPGAGGPRPSLSPG